MMRTTLLDSNGHNTRLVQQSWYLLLAKYSPQMCKSSVDPAGVSTSSPVPSFVSTYSCVARRTKIILHALVCAFDVELAVSPGDVGFKRKIMSRPCVLNRESEARRCPSC
jgi:hypothetical protein